MADPFLQDYSDAYEAFGALGYAKSPVAMKAGGTSFTPLASLAH